MPNNGGGGQDQPGWSRELLYQLVNNVREYAITVTDPKGIVVSWNPGGEKLFGYTSDEAIGLDSRVLFTPEDRATREPEKEMKAALRDGCAEDERWHMRKDGTRLFVSGIQTPLFDDNGEHIGFAKIARDTTQRNQAQEKLREAFGQVDALVHERAGEIEASNEQLRLEVLQRDEAVRMRAALVARIVRAQEDERRRIALDIHDNIGQHVTALQLGLKKLLDDCGNDPATAEEIERMQSIANRIDGEVDFLTWELRPAILDDLGLEAAMEEYVKDWSRHFQIPADFVVAGCDVEGTMPPEVSVNLYRILQEALNNTAKHARAQRAQATLECKGGVIRLVVDDDGVGFDMEKVVNAGGTDRGLGLLGMAERADLIGGVCEIESTPGGGTSVFVRVPERKS